MNAADRRKKRLEELEEMKRENGVTIDNARREERSGPLAAYREELRHRSTSLIGGASKVPARPAK